MNLAARPPIMWADAFAPGPVMIRGTTEASATRKPRMRVREEWEANRNCARCAVIIDLIPELIFQGKTEVIFGNE